MDEVYGDSGQVKWVMGSFIIMRSCELSSIKKRKFVACKEHSRVKIEAVSFQEIFCEF